MKKIIFFQKLKILTFIFSYIKERKVVKSCHFFLLRKIG